MDNISREMKILRIEKKARDKKHLEVKNTIDGLISSWDMAEKGISDLENILIESSKLKKNIKNKD